MVLVRRGGTASYAGGAAAEGDDTVWVPPYGLSKVTFTRSPGRSL